MTMVMGYYTLPFNLLPYYDDIDAYFVLLVFTADFGFARFLHDGVMAATLCGSPLYMVGG